MANPETIATHVRALFAAWNRKTSIDTFRAFELGLIDLTDSQTTEGFTRAIQAGGEHPPSVGQVRAYCLRRSTMDNEAMAQAAFERADRLARSEGVASHPARLDDPLLTHAIGAVGGWSAFCKSPVDHWQRKNFVQAYVEAASNPQLEQVARLSHNGEPIGALAGPRKEMAKAIGVKHIN